MSQMKKKEQEESTNIFFSHIKEMKGKDGQRYEYLLLLKYKPWNVKKTENERLGRLIKVNYDLEYTYYAWSVQTYT